MREGVLYDLVGRINREDVRDRTIRWFQLHYQVDLEQAERVAAAELVSVDPLPFLDVGVKRGQVPVAVHAGDRGQGVLGDALTEHPLPPGEVDLAPVGRLVVQRQLNEHLAGQDEHRDRGQG